MRQPRLRSQTDRQLWHALAESFTAGMTAERQAEAVLAFTRADRVLVELARRGALAGQGCTCEQCMVFLLDEDTPTP